MSYGICSSFFILLVRWKYLIKINFIQITDIFFELSIFVTSWSVLQNLKTGENKIKDPLFKKMLALVAYAVTFGIQSSNPVKIGSFSKISNQSMMQFDISVK